MSQHRERPKGSEKVAETPAADEAALDAAWAEAQAAFRADPERFRAARRRAPKPRRSVGRRLLEWLRLG